VTKIYSICLRFYAYWCHPLVLLRCCLPACSNCLLCSLSVFVVVFVHAFYLCPLLLRSILSSSCGDYLCLKETYRKNNCSNINCSYSYNTLWTGCILCFSLLNMADRSHNIMVLVHVVATHYTLLWHHADV
jgi:hypothetical protein